MNIPVIYEDNWLLIVDKPAGLLSIPTPKNEKRTLTGILNDDAKERGLPYRLHPCHRLDRETSGLVIYAKGKAAQKKMMELFKQRKVKKTYIAFVQGAPSLSRGRIKYPIADQPAVTEYKTVEKRKGFSVLEAMPVTGRTNQIRIHFKNNGYPILGDTKYAYRRDFKIKVKRLCLHAAALSFTHPMTGIPVYAGAPMAADMRDFLKARAF